MAGLRIAIAVTNDLVHDRRVLKVAHSLSKGGYKVTLVGRASKLLPATTTIQGLNALPLSAPVSKGVGFYAWFNWLLFWKLIQLKPAIILANDADTLLASTLAALVLRAKLVYDSHELFSLVPELAKKPFVRAVWQGIERVCLPFTHARYTVSVGYQTWLQAQYRLPFDKVENRPEELPEAIAPIMPDRPYLVYLGKVHAGRGVEVLINALPALSLDLIVIGDGDELDAFIALADSLGLAGRIKFFGLLEEEAWQPWVAGAYAGCCLLSAEESYYYSAANKFFDYAQGGIPILFAPYPSYLGLAAEYEVGLPCGYNSESVVEQVNCWLSSPDLYTKHKAQAKLAAKAWTWEGEEACLLAIFSSLGE